MHKTRSNRKANEARRIKLGKLHQPLPIEVQQQISEERKAEKLNKYPVPPKYRYRDSDPQPIQPMCYYGWLSALKGQKYE